jgi:hypothetical protein
VLTVVAPPDTRVGLGKEYQGVACTADVLTPGAIPTYEVTCPPSGVGDELVATISYGEWDYTFMKAL